MIDQATIDGLDAGIRRLVVLMNQAGWSTTDSGDGVSKVDMECAMPMPHVIVAPVSEVAQAVNLHLLVRDWLRAEAMERLDCQFMYSTKDRVGTIIVLGVSDEDLLEELKS